MYNDSNRSAAISLEHNDVVAPTLARKSFLRAGIYIGRSFRNDRRTISIEEGGTNGRVHLAHLTVSRTYACLVLFLLSFLLSRACPLSHLDATYECVSVCMYRSDLVTSAS